MSNLYVNNVHPRTGSLVETHAFAAALGMGNAQTINAGATVPATYNCILFGPITIGTSGILTISSGSAVKVKDIGEF
tara:strand:- start:2753 stop:2983 length:231 start_codon:yes stop_codon:yes gene_type:complete